ncbi:MAG: M50 family metallopeptidase [Kiritimatiellae bacterium]|jgi:Zn-dependent protease|nr:M50 family metallopeptidase [Kiritimatiellia bacterium]
MIGSFLLTTVRDVPIRIHFTAFFLLPMIYNVVPSLWVALLYSLIILLSVTLHELGHTVVAQRYGIRVQDIVLTPIGGVARLTGIPENSHHEIRIALAGPYISLMLALSGAALCFLSTFTGSRLLFALFFLFTTVNTMLLLFNMLPSFPMDGGRVLRGWLSQKRGALEATRIASQIGKYMSIGFIVIGLTTGRLSLALIGVFILLSGGSEYRMMQVKAWQEAQLGVDSLSPEPEFTASPPPYATASTLHAPEGFLGDLLLTFRDLYQEICRNFFKG